MWALYFATGLFVGVALTLAIGAASGWVDRYLDGGEE